MSSFSGGDVCYRTKVNDESNLAGQWFANHLRYVGKFVYF